MQSVRVSIVALGLVFIGGLFVLPGGCDDLPTTTVVRRIEDPWLLAQGVGLLPVIVRGRPAFAADAAVEEAVFRAAERAITWTATPPLVRAGAGHAAGDLRLVYLFNDTGDPCRGTAIGGEPLPQGRVVLVAALCSGEEMLVRVDGRVGRSAGLDSRPLLRLIGQATRDLLAPPPAPRP